MTNQDEELNREIMGLERHFGIWWSENELEIVHRMLNKARQQGADNMREKRILEWVLSD